VQDASRIMHGITVASREQHGGIDQVNAAMRELDGITRENAALVEEAAAASGNVAEQAGHLSQALSVFKTARRAF
jgi:aerotaxis receptor